MKQLLNSLKQYIKKNQYLKYWIKKIIPISIFHKIRKYMYYKDAGFKSFYIDNREIKFHLGSLEDNRGIGRVSREQFNCFSNKSSIENKILDDNPIHFYPSIHWCPDKLPNNSIVSILDVIPMVFPQKFEESSKQWANEYYAIAHQATHIITISETSKNDIVKYLDINPNIVTVITIGVNKFENILDFKIELPKNYFVYLGSYDSHKNLDIILEALALDKCKDFKLVMIGDNLECKPKVNRLQIDDRVSFLGRLSDGEIAFVIQNSMAILFPSLYEGFGLPPMEAGVLGVPSICSRRPTMTEFLYDVALFAEPDDVNEWADNMYDLAYDMELRERIGKLAREKVSNFKWETSCNNLVDIVTK